MAKGRRRPRGIEEVDVGINDRNYDRDSAARPRRRTCAGDGKPQTELQNLSPVHSDLCSYGQSALEGDLLNCTTGENRGKGELM